jgi:hypothetical protein
VPLLFLHIFYGTCSSNVIKFTVGAGDRELLDNLSCWDALRAVLPVGTVSGAPKV